MIIPTFMHTHAQKKRSGVHNTALMTMERDSLMCFGLDEILRTMVGLSMGVDAVGAVEVDDASVGVIVSVGGGGDGHGVGGRSFAGADGHMLPQHVSACGHVQSLRVDWM